MCSSCVMAWQVVPTKADRGAECGCPSTAGAARERGGDPACACGAHQRPSLGSDGGLADIPVPLVMVESW